MEQTKGILEYVVQELTATEGKVTLKFVTQFEGSPIMVELEAKLTKLPKDIPHDPK